MSDSKPKSSAECTGLFHCTSSISTTNYYYSPCLYQLDDVISRLTQVFEEYKDIQLIIHPSSTWVTPIVAQSLATCRMLRQPQPQPDLLYYKLPSTSVFAEATHLPSTTFGAPRASGTILSGAIQGQSAEMANFTAAKVGSLVRAI